MAMSLKMPPPPATYLRGGGAGSREHSFTTIRSPIVPAGRAWPQAHGSAASARRQQTVGRG
jgi:hypothetical protein